MNIEILHLTDGAKQATGLTVIIDVFRAFTLEAVLFERGVKRIFPVGSLDDAWELKRRYPDALLVGERDGKKVEGFDYGNAPSAVESLDLTEKEVIHTTSAGTQGIMLASQAEQILTGALINAKATANFIQKQNPQQVSLVAMGWKGQRDTEEDVLCAEYIKALLEQRPFPDLQERAWALKDTDGKQFFDPTKQEIFPRADFDSCIAINRCPYAIRVVKEDGMFVAYKEKCE